MQHTSSPPETWKPVVGWEGFYDVSNQGRVKSVTRKIQRSNGCPQTVRERVLKQTQNKSGHMYVSLRRPGEHFPVTVHTLVMAAFVGPRPESMEVCHIDGDPTNNWASNLRYGTRSDNLHDLVRHGGHHQARKTHCIRGHVLAGPNLVASYMKRGRRNCLACGRARSRVRSNPHLRPYFQEVSDSYYAAILAP